MEIKGKYKTKVGMYNTINKDVMNEFIELSQKKSINRSQLLEHYIIDWIKKNK